MFQMIETETLAYIEANEPCTVDFQHKSKTRKIWKSLSAVIGVDR